MHVSCEDFRESALQRHLTVSSGIKLPIKLLRHIDGLAARRFNHNICFSFVTAWKPIGSQYITKGLLWVIWDSSLHHRLSLANGTNKITVKPLI